MDALLITGLRKRFGDREVLTGLDLAVPEHSVFGFIGRNGAGKTTTMKTVLGLLKADAGEILVCGEKAVHGRTSTNRHIGYLPDVPAFYPFMTAPEYLRFCGRITGMPEQDLEERSREMLELVGLKGEKHRIKGYSRGMKQRLGIAQALLNRPRLLICDEPTSALDPPGRKEILDLLLAVRDRTTVLFSTHILSDVERICTDVALLDHGRADVRGTLAAIRARSGSREYLLETENGEGCAALRRAFPAMRDGGVNQLVFSEKDHAAPDVLRFCADQRLPLIKMERMEGTLESLFTEAEEK